MASDAELQARLTEAETALHKLQIGALEVEVDYDGHSTTYNRASLPELRRYIRELKVQLGEDMGSRARRVVY